MKIYWSGVWLVSEKNFFFFLLEGKMFSGEEEEDMIMSAACINTPYDTSVNVFGIKQDPRVFFPCSLK